MNARIQSIYDHQSAAGRPGSTMHIVIYAIINAMLWGSVLAIAWPLLQR